MPDVRKPKADNVKSLQSSLTMSVYFKMKVISISVSQTSLATHYRLQKALKIKKNVKTLKT